MKNYRLPIEKLQQYCKKERHLIKDCRPVKWKNEQKNKN